MERLIPRLPLFVTATALVLMWLYGPIPQPADYHRFADGRNLAGLGNAADVLSNIGFAIVGIWGALKISGRHGALEQSWEGYRLFLFSLVATAAGSAFYHLQPDNFRLVWDRLPIALACAGLLGGVYRDTHKQTTLPFATALMALTAFASVGWWYAGELKGHGDLRPYLLLQALPLVLIPLWQHIHRADRSDRRAFLLAIALYVCAKLAELQDHEMMLLSGWISGHTVKHLLATAAAAVITCRLVHRTAGQEGGDLTITRPLRRRSPVRGSCV